MDYDGRVIFKIDGDDSGIQQSIKNTTNSLGGLKSTLVKLGIGVLVAKTVKDTIKLTKESIKNANELEQSLAKASTLFGEVAVDTDNLNKRILELSSVTGQAASSIGNSLYNALSAGVEVTEDMGTAMDFLESATKLSIAGFTDVDTAVTATAKVMNAYGKEMYSAERIGEVLMQTQNLGITTVDQLGSALATVTPIAASFGVSFEQVGASLALMTKQGTDTATATTQLRGMISELGQDGTTASKNLQKAFARTGKEYKNFAEYMRDPDNNLQGAIRLLEEEAELAGLSLSDMFGNIRAGVGALQLAKDDTEMYSQFLKNLAGDTNLVEDAYNKMMDTRTNKWKRMKEQLKNISIKLAGSDTANATLDHFTELAQGILDKIDKWADSSNNFGRKIKLVFLSLQGEYERSFLKKGIDFVIRIAKNELQDIINQFKSGNIFGGLAEIVGDVLMINVGFMLASGAVTNLANSMVGTAFGTIGAFLSDVLVLYVGFTKTQTGEYSVAQFALQTAISLAAAFGAMCLTENPVVSGLVFGVTFKLLGWIWGDDSYTPRQGNAPTRSSEDSHGGGVKLDTEGDAGQILKYLYKLDENHETYKKLRESGEAIGKYLAEGVALGLISDEQVVRYSVYSLADLLNEEMQTAEQIHSPSKVWEKYGEFLTQGLAEGLHGEEAKQYAKDAVAELTAILEDEVKSGAVSLSEAFAASDFIEQVDNSFAEGLTNAYMLKNPQHEEQPENQNPLPEEMPIKVSLLEELAKALSTDIHAGWELFIQDITDAENKSKIWQETFQEAFDLIGSSFEELGESIAEGEADWSVFAKAGLNAISTILEAIGKELSVIAIEAIVAENYPKAILAGAGSASAFVAAGLVKGWANSFERGGIVGGSGITGDRHVIFANAGELILSKAQQGAIASQLAGNNSPNITIAFNGQVFGDQATISSYVYDGIRNAQREGGLPSW